MKVKPLKITKGQQYKMLRKASRELEIEVNGGWVSKHKIHRSKKAYHRKCKHKSQY